MTMTDALKGPRYSMMVITPAEGTKIIPFPEKPLPPEGTMCHFCGCPYRKNRSLCTREVHAGYRASDYIRLVVGEDGDFTSDDHGNVTSGHSKTLDGPSCYLIDRDALPRPATPAVVTSFEDNDGSDGGASVLRCAYATSEVKQ